MRGRFILIVMLTIMVVLFGIISSGSVIAADTSQNYIVLFAGQSVPADASSLIANAGGTLVYSYNAIGVAVASSASNTFRSNLLKDQRVENASSTARFGIQLTDRLVDAGADSAI